MNSFELLRSLKGKIEVDSALEETNAAVTEVSGNRLEAKFIVLKEIEGKLKAIEVSARMRDN